MDQLLGNALAQRRLTLTLLVSLAVLALLLASVGIYGVISYAVTQRTHEFGIRIALGGRSRNVLMLVIRQGVILAVIGVAIGLSASFALTRLIKNLLYGVSETDPLTFIVVSLLPILVALLACWLPARRAMKVDPIAALRRE
jgi:ABC-type antimicrobial peptide transport system permease subunit